MVNEKGQDRQELLVNFSRPLKTGTIILIKSRQ